MTKPNNSRQPKGGRIADLWGDLNFNERNPVGVTRLRNGKELKPNASEEVGTEESKND